MRTSRLAKISRIAQRKPKMRTAQAQPTRSNRLVNISGKITPPMAPPVLAIPDARPRRSRKKWPMAVMQGVKRRDVPKPKRIPKQRRKCQYSIITYQ